MGLKSFANNNDNICKCYNFVNQFSDVVLNDRQDPLNTMNMEIYVHVGGLSTAVCIFRHDWDNTLVNNVTELDEFLDMNTSPLGK